MSVILKFILPSFLIGAIAGAAGWYLFSPLFIDNIVAEELAVAETQLTGTFVNADNAHQGSGTVMVVTRADGVTEAQFTDFEVTNGPDLKVSLSAHPNPTSSDDVKGADWVSLGALKGNIGNQALSLIHI